MIKYVLLLTTALTLSACSSNIFESWDEDPDGAHIPVEELNAYKGSVYKIEKPYDINGVWYFPAENYSYQEQGPASWYAPSNGQPTKTANGEEYIPTELTARHKTLPLPSIVKITNLENGKSIIARVNDRGPMVNNRLIDVSQRAAQELGFPVSGTAQVKVEVLAEESKAVRDALVSAGRVYTEQRIEQNDLTIVPPALIPNEEQVLYAPTQTPATTQQPAPQPIQQTVVYSRPNQTASANGIYVQLGAFSDSSNATKATAAANRVGQVITKTKILGNRSLSVVQAGPFATRAEAEKALKTLKQSGYRDAFILR